MCGVVQGSKGKAGQSQTSTTQDAPTRASSKAPGPILAAGEKVSSETALAANSPVHNGLTTSSLAPGSPPPATGFRHSDAQQQSLRHTESQHVGRQQAEYGTLVEGSVVFEQEPPAAPTDAVVTEGQTTSSPGSGARASEQKTAGNSPTPKALPQQPSRAGEGLAASSPTRAAPASPSEVAATKASTASALLVEAPPAAQAAASAPPKKAGAITSAPSAAAAAAAAFRQNPRSPAEAAGRPVPGSPVRKPVIWAAMTATGQPRNPSVQPSAPPLHPTSLAATSNSTSQAIASAVPAQGSNAGSSQSAAEAQQAQRAQQAAKPRQGIVMSVRPKMDMMGRPTAEMEAVPVGMAPPVSGSLGMAPPVLGSLGTAAAKPPSVSNPSVASTTADKTAPSVSSPVAVAAAVDKMPSSNRPAVAAVAAVDDSKLSVNSPAASSVVQSAPITTSVGAAAAAAKVPRVSRSYLEAEEERSSGTAQRKQAVQTGFDAAQMREAAAKAGAAVASIEALMAAQPPLAEEEAAAGQATASPGSNAASSEAARASPKASRASPVRAEASPAQSRPGSANPPASSAHKKKNGRKGMQDDRVAAPALAAAASSLSHGAGDDSFAQDLPNSSSSRDTPR